VYIAPRLIPDENSKHVNSLRSRRERDSVPRRVAISRASPDPIPENRDLASRLTSTRAMDDAIRAIGLVRFE